jgi:hypothetical protein
MKNQNLLIGIGFIILSLSILLKQLTDLPDFASGLGMGIGVGIELLGAFLKSRQRYNKQ